MSKIRIGVLFGGRSAEHEVSVRSARNVVAALDPKKYEITLIGIDKQGRWMLGDHGRLMLDSGAQPTVTEIATSREVVLLPRSEKPVLFPTGDLAPGEISKEAVLDVIFPVLHGPLGEDGTVQGLLRLADIPFVGPDVLGSAVGMDKEVMKRLLHEAGIPSARYVALRSYERSGVNYEQIFTTLGSPVFVKPANMGSSVGVSKAATIPELTRAIAHAFEYDRKVLVEEFIQGREIECAVLGNELPEASLPGEIIHGSQHEFYSYEAKYLDCEGQRIEIPANLPAETIAALRQLAVKVFEVLCCEGMSRVDFFVTAEGRVYVNEINTIPGFTNISMYPMLWQASGVSYSELINRLVKLALERHSQLRALKDRPEKSAQG